MQNDGGFVSVILLYRTMTFIPFMINLMTHSIPQIIIQRFIDNKLEWI
jgi:hypothetical protein